MIDYTWVEWFKELVDRIAKKGEEYLVESAGNVAWEEDGQGAFLAYGDKNIDPFSFLYFLAHKNTPKQYNRVFGSVHEVFGIKSGFPKTAHIPTPTPTTTMLFHNMRSFKLDLLWRLFRQAARQTPNIEFDDFNEALTIPSVDIVKLTQTLFLVNPNHFLPVDDTNKVLGPEFGEDVDNCQAYQNRMKFIKRRFPGCTFYEINTFLDAQADKKPLITNETSFFQISTNVENSDTDYWRQSEGDKLSFEKHNRVYTRGGGGTKRKYPLTEPQRGDVILVRYSGEGRAIGVVESNQYHPKGWSKGAFISVYWINKTSTPLKDMNENLTMIAFSRPEKLLAAFRKTKDYKFSFRLIDHCMGGNEDSPHSKEDAAPNQEGDDRGSLNTILFGPPGTGKTWEAVSRAVAIVDNEDPAKLAQAENREEIKARIEELREGGRVEFVTFHQNYTYEDFIEGIGPRLNRNALLYELRDGVFKRISSRAHEHPKERYVLIIDEINRGNIAKIFGELITLIEPSKRSGGDDAAVVTLPYSQQPFSVPGNLYLVGTMNTADRGIALLDTALRRRFDFIEKMPDVRLVKKNIAGVNGQLMLKAMNKRITVYLGREHQIGHTYLIGVETIDRLAEAFQRRIVPLLQEYFYDDWAKIRSVLNENPFIRELKIETTIRDDHSERPVFELLPPSHRKWKDPESYQQIYAGEQAQGAD